MTGRPTIPYPWTTAAAPAGGGAPRDLSVLGPWPDPWTAFGPACPPRFAQPHESAVPRHEPAPTTVTLSLAALAALRFVHGYTEVFPESTAARGLAIVGATRHGTTRWVASRPGQPGIWMAWSWAHIQPGIVMLDNPLELNSNIAIVGADGRRLSSMESMIRLNCVIHALDWHRVVRRAGGPLSPCERCE